MDFNTLKKFIQYLIDFCEHIRKDSIVSDSEWSQFTNEILHFKKQLANSKTIKQEFRDEINSLFGDINIKPERDFIQFLQDFFDKYNTNHISSNINRTFILNQIEERLTNLLHTLTEDKVYW